MIAYPVLNMHLFAQPALLNLTNNISLNNFLFSSSPGSKKGRQRHQRGSRGAKNKNNGLNLATASPVPTPGKRWRCALSSEQVGSYSDLFLVLYPQNRWAASLLFLGLYPQNRWAASLHCLLLYPQNRWAATLHCLLLYSQNRWDATLHCLLLYPQNRWLASCTSCTAVAAWWYIVRRIHRNLVFWGNFNESYFFFLSLSHNTSSSNGPVLLYSFNILKPTGPLPFTNIFFL